MNMRQNRSSAEKLLALFRGVLLDRLKIEQIDVEYEPVQWTSRPDLALRIPIDGEIVHVLIELKRHIFPRDIEAARPRLAELTETGRSFDQVMVWAESLSGGARRSLESMGIGYFDASGSLSLRLGARQVLIDRTPPRPRWRDVGVLFTPERAKVLHALLQGGRAWYSGADLVKASGASPNTVSVLMRELERRGMVRTEGSGRSLRRELLAPDDLLNEWGHHWPPSSHRKTRWFAFAQNPATLPVLIANRLDKLQPFDWAFTGEYAANSLTPLLTAVNGYELIVPSGSAGFIAHHLELQAVDRAFNVTIHECEEFVLQHRFTGNDRLGWFASPLIQYLDLFQAGGRGPELADELKKELLM
jgi:DNA-binding transcriptional ArsR family regulator